MFSHSQSQTPIPTQGQYHEKLAETVTWVKDWYIPQLPSSSESIPQSIRLKGWFKTNINHKSSTQLRLSSDDVIDLSSWKYIKDTIVPEPEAPLKPSSELKTALSVENE